MKKKKSIAVIAVAIALTLGGFFLVVNTMKTSTKKTAPTTQTKKIKPIKRDQKVKVKSNEVYVTVE